MSEKCFHCKRSLNKKFRVKVDGNIYCATCYDKLKKSGEIKSKVEPKTEKTNIQKESHKCECKNHNCQNKTNYKSEQMANDFLKTFREYSGTKNISIQITNGLANAQIYFINENGTETKIYQNNIKVLCHEELLKSIMKSIFEQQIREDKFRKNVLNEELKKELNNIQEQIEKNKKEME